MRSDSSFWIRISFKFLYYYWIWVNLSYFIINSFRNYFINYICSISLAALTSIYSLLVLLLAFIFYIFSNLALISSFYLVFKLSIYPNLRTSHCKVSHSCSLAVSTVLFYVNSLVTWWYLCWNAWDYSLIAFILFYSYFYIYKMCIFLFLSYSSLLFVIISRISYYFATSCCCRICNCFYLFDNSS